MSRFVAFLRAINVGNGRTVRMDSLHQLFESLGFSGVETFIASGNVVFETGTKNTKALERKIEKKLREALGYEVAAFIRTDKELAKIANYKPFRQSKIGAAELNIIFLADPLNEKFKKKVRRLERTRMSSVFTDVRFTGCVTKSEASPPFPRCHLIKLSISRLQSAQLRQSKG